MFRFILLTIPVFVSIYSFSQGTTLSLKDCLSFGLENSHQVRNAKLDASNLEHQIKEGKSQGFPKIYATSDYRRMLNLPVQQLPGEFFGMPGETIPIRFGTDNIWNSGIILDQVIFNKYLFELTKMEGDSRLLYGLLVEKAEEETIYAIAEQYFSILKNEEQRKLLDLNTERLNKLEEMVWLQVENDFAKPSDLAKIKVQKAELEVHRLQLETGLNAQYYGLKLQMGMDISKDIRLKPARIPFPRKLPDARPNSEQISFKLMNQQARLEERQYNAIKASGLPTLQAKGYIGFQFQENDFQIFGDNKWSNTTWVGLSMHAPIFDGFARKSRMEQSKVSLEKIKLNYETASQFSNFESEIARADLEHKERLMTAQQKMIDLSKDLHNQMVLQYTEGNAVLLEMLNTRADLQQAELTWQQLSFDYQMAMLKLMKVEGRIRQVLNF